MTYTDVFVFVERLKDLAARYGKDTIRDLIYPCLKGRCLQWFTDLTELEKELLYEANFDQWCTAMLRDLKLRTAEAMVQLEASTYGLRELRQGTTPRAYVHKVRSLARSMGLESMQLQLTTAWNHMYVDLRQHIPEPTSSTTLSQFYEQIDAKTSIWKELLQRRPWDPGPGQPPQRSFPPPQQQQ